MWMDLIEGAKQLVFPDNCFLCRRYLNNRHQSQLCQACLATIKRNVPPFCLRCSRHLPYYTVDATCTDCSKNSYHFDRCWSACLYDEELSRLLHAFKYNGKTAWQKTFLMLMRQFIDEYQVPLGQFDFMAPVPLHPARLRERGYNQANLLAQGLCRCYPMAAAPKLLLRTRMTGSQTRLHQKQRWTNLQGAFRINPSIPVAEKSILLVDDLLTTGATADAAAQCLKEAGAAYVGVLTLAITP
jgi:competence protein ComFC